jgi:polyhydroxyalkanoate synthesis regulator phasin
MDKKIKPAFSTETFGDEQKEFEAKIQSSNFEDAVRICRQPNDQRGHNEKISFRLLPYYTRLGSELMAREPRFRTISDFWRTAVNLGCKHILQELKNKGKVGSEFDDLLLITDEMEREMNADQAYRHFEKMIKKLPRSLELYRKDRGAFKSKVENLEKRIRELNDPFWRNRLMKRFNEALRSLNGDLESDDLQWEEDEEL